MSTQSPVLDTGEVLLIDGRHAFVIFTRGEAEVYVSSSVKCPTAPLNDPWWLPADPAILRGLAADLTAAADELDTL